MDKRIQNGFLNDPKIRRISLEAPEYPPLLKLIDDPPQAFYAYGDLTALSLPQIAVVGSRNATPDGIDMARQLSAELARHGLVVTSGMAIGIDSAGHRGALDADGQTIAVLGTGLNVDYPRGSAPLKRAILASDGALISELEPDCPPKPVNFPRRNRIISGLCVGTLVVEAGLRSGSLITARLALEQGREVFAVPGSPRNPLTRGCHALLRDGAKLVERVEDIFEEIGSLLEIPNKKNETDQEDLLSEEDESVRNLLQSIGYTPTPVDYIATRTQLNAETLLATLVDLELRGRVERCPGGYRRR